MNLNPKMLIYQPNLLPKNIKKLKISYIKLKKQKIL